MSMDEPVVEHAIAYTGGGMLVRPNDPVIEEILSTEKWIEIHQRNGGKVFRRTVIVREDWIQVPAPGVTETSPSVPLQ